MVHARDDVVILTHRERGAARERPSVAYPCLTAALAFDPRRSSTIARQLDMSPTWFSGIVTGRAPVPELRAAEISETLGIPADVLFDPDAVVTVARGRAS